jgi:hypothetical protein
MTHRSARPSAAIDVTPPDAFQLKYYAPRSRQRPGGLARCEGGRSGVLALERMPRLDAEQMAPVRSAVKDPEHSAYLGNPDIHGATAPAR